MAIQIPEQYFSFFQKAGKSILLPKKSMVIMEEEVSNGLYLIKEGFVRVFSITPDGKEITMEVLKKGRVFGDSAFLFQSHYKVNVETIEDTELIFCDITDAIHLFKDSEELLLLMFQHMTETCNHLSHQIARLACYDSRQKIIDFLLVEYHDRGAGNAITYTHDELAGCLGLNRVTVSRILKSLAKEGLIDCGYKKIFVIKPDQMAECLILNS